MRIINADGLVLGRMATYVAKLALQGEKVIVVNCEKAVVSGKKKMVETHYLERRQRGEAFHGPFFPRRADLIVRRAIRGMVPWKIDRGRKAFKRVMCYLGVPNRYAEQKIETVESAAVANLRTGNYVEVGKIAKRLGDKHAIR